MVPREKLLFIAPLAIVGFAAFVLVGGWVTMTLWNWLTPSLFGWRELDLKHALGLLVLCRLLFGSFGMGHGGPPAFMRRRMFERWERMSDEERARIRERMRGGESTAT